MSKSTLNFILDAALLVAFVVLLGTQILMHGVFPAASESQGWALWGLNYDRWSRVSFISLAVFALGILVHVMLHWTWVCGFITARLSRWAKRAISLKDGERTLIGVGLLTGVIVIILAFMLLAQLNMIRPAGVS